MDPLTSRHAELWFHLMPLAPTPEELRTLSDRLNRSLLIQGLMDLMVEFKIVEVTLSFDDEGYPYLVDVTTDPEEGAQPTYDLKNQEVQAQIEGWICDHQTPLKEQRGDLMALGLVDVPLDVTQADRWRTRAMGKEFEAEVAARQRSAQRETHLAQQPASPRAGTRRRT